MRALALAWAVCVLAAAGVLTLRIAGGYPVETRILSMLPPSAGDAGMAAAEAHLSETVSRRLLILTSHPEATAARRAAGQLELALTSAGLAERTALGVSEAAIEDILARLARHAGALLSERDRTDLAAGRSEAVASRALARALLPLPMAGADTMAHDPLLLSLGFLAGLPRPTSPLASAEGRLEGRDGDRHVVFSVLTVVGDPFSGAVQGPLVGHLQQERAALLADHPGLVVRAAGAALYAAAGTRDALNDVSRLGIIDTAATLALLLLAFRSIGALALVALPVITGSLVGGAAVTLAFPAVHGLALIFGTTMIGTAVDYAIHYVSGRYAAPDPGARLRLVRMGTFLGLITTVIGYLAMLPSPFPALRELALFSATGLTAAWITVVLWLPRLDRAAQRDLPRSIAAAFGWIGRHVRPIALTGSALLVALVAAGAPRLTASDDLRRFQSLPPDLRAEEAEIRRLTGTALAPVVLTVAGESTEIALQREEALHQRLAARGIAAEGVARYLPSQARQQQNLALLDAALPGERLGPLAGVWRRVLAEPFRPLTLAELPAPLASRVASLRIERGDGAVLHLVQIPESGGAAMIHEAIVGLPGVAVLDVPGRINAGFAEQRRHTLFLLAALILLTLAIATIRYGWRGGLRTTIAPALATLATPPVLALFGQPFSFFNAIGLLLVVALGVDYAFYWSEADQSHRHYTALAVLVSMLATVVTFGLLTLSRTEALGAFGATVAVGTLLSAALAPIAGSRSR